MPTRTLPLLFRTLPLIVVLSLGAGAVDLRAQAQSLAGHADDTEAFAPSQGSAEPPSGEAVDLDADQLYHDQETGIVTASGNVFLTQGGRILRADELSYNLKTGEATARGNVVLNEANGDVHFSEEVVLREGMKNGVVRELKSYLTDGARFTAREGERIGGSKTVMHEATYTPCEPCKKNPERPPVWQLRASEVTHDEEENTITYRNARFEFFGVPLAYTPYFTHPDGTIKRKSGFLSPSAGYKSELGVFVGNSYYWDIAPGKDATLGLIVMGKEAPLAKGEWRQRWKSASLLAEGGLTYSGRKDSESGLGVKQEEEWRGHVFAEGIWDVNEKWRGGTRVKWASDDQYLRQYDLGDEDVLENEIYAERFSGRDYGVVRALLFQDLRVRDEQEDQPEVLPEVVADFMGEPDSVPLIGGRWEAGGSLLELRRSGGGQDVTRLSLNTGWNKRLVSDYGLLTMADVGMRADFYSARDRDVAVAGSGRSTESEDVRLFPQAHIQSSYPVVKTFETIQAVVEPVAALTAAPDIDVTQDIPNEDSRDVQIDSSNLFEPNRFPGLDRVEDQSRVTYGVRSGLYGADGSYGGVFIGQSFRFDDKGNPFPEGSGLNDRVSDIVGEFSAHTKNKYGMNYRFQLDGRDLASQRHEVDANARWRRLSVNGRYLFAKALAGTDIDESREQLQMDAAYYVTPSWRVRTGGTQDMGESPGLRRAYGGIDYLGQCLSWSLTGERNLTDDTSGDSSTEILFRIGLKNLGEFERSGLRKSSTK